MVIDVAGLVALVAAVPACLKGRYALAIAGFVVLSGIPAMIAAVRLARVDSWWAKRFYDDEKMQRSAERYPGKSEIRDALML
jgi:hypothetical protein